MQLTDASAATTRWIPTNRLRHTIQGQRITFHGHGVDTSVCGSLAADRGGCNFPSVDVRLRRDRSYRVTENKKVLHGDHSVLSGDRVRLDRGARGGRTSVVPMYEWRGLVHGTSTLVGLDVGSYFLSRER